MIRAIISDLGNVLVQFDHMRTCNSLSVKCGLTPARVHEILFGSGLEKSFDLGRIGAEDFAKSINDRLDSSIAISEIRKAWEAIFWPLDGMESLVKSLKAEYRLILLSNTNAWHFEYCCRNFAVLQLFDAFVLSYTQGFRKPDPEIFKKAIQESGHTPEECLYIDDIEAYVNAAAALGIKSICFQGVDRLKSDLLAHGITLS